MCSQLRGSRTYQASIALGFILASCVLAVTTHQGDEIVTTEHTFALNLRSTDSVYRLKQLLSEKEGLVMGQQRLLFKGQVLNDDSRTLKDYGIDSNSTVTLAEDRDSDAGKIESGALSRFAKSPAAKDSIKLRVHRIGR